MGDIQSPKLLYFKGALFLFLGVLASAMIIWQHPSASVILPLVIAIWAFARAYYFAFYVVEHYIDPGHKYAGLLAFLRYVAQRRRQ